VAIEDRGDEHFADLRLQPDLAAKREVDELIPHIVKWGQSCKYCGERIERMPRRWRRNTCSSDPI
jgi:hypothetical protein